MKEDPHKALRSLRQYLLRDGHRSFGGGLQLADADAAIQYFWNDTDQARGLAPIAHGIEYLYALDDSGAVVGLGEAIVPVAVSFSQFLALAACGFACPAEPDRWKDERFEPDHPPGFLDWLSSRLGLVPSHQPARIIDRARRECAMLIEELAHRREEAFAPLQAKTLQNSRDIQAARAEARRTDPSAAPLAQIIERAKDIRVSQLKAAFYPGKFGLEEHAAIMLDGWCVRLSWHMSIDDERVAAEREVVGSGLLDSLEAHPASPGVLQALESLEYAEGLQRCRALPPNPSLIETIAKLEQIIAARPNPEVVSKVNDWSDL